MKFIITYRELDGGTREESIEANSFDEAVEIFDSKHVTLRIERLTVMGYGEGNKV